jgi:hypothetical protein
VAAEAYVLRVVGELHAANVGDWRAAVNEVDR